MNAGHTGCETESAASLQSVQQPFILADVRRNASRWDGACRSERPFHPARLWDAAFEAPRLPPTLRSKGFFWVAARPQRLWQWSTAGEGLVGSKRPR